MGQQERAQAILHSILVRALSCPSRLLRFPLAFLEAFPGFLVSSPTDSLPRVVSDGIGTAEGRGRLLLIPGLWKRAALAALFPGGKAVSNGGGAALISARLKSVCLYREGVRNEIDYASFANAGGNDSRGEATRLAESVLEAIGQLHCGDARFCPLCCGGDGLGEAYGGDDALAVASWNEGGVGGTGSFPDMIDGECYLPTVIVIPFVGHRPSLTWSYFPNSAESCWPPCW